MGWMQVVQRPEYPSHCVVVEEASHPPPPELPPAETLEMELTLLMCGPGSSVETGPDFIWARSPDKNEGVACSLSTLLQVQLCCWAYVEATKEAQKKMKAWIQASCY